MPTYEYHCSSCKASYDLRQSFSAETTHTCEECGKGIAKRVLHAPKVVFKGSGFYATDSRNKSSSFADSPPDSGDSKTDAADTKSEAKPDSKKKSESKAEPAAADAAAAS